MGITVASPFPAWALPQVWAWIESFRDRVCDDYAPKSLDEFLAEWEQRQPRERSWAVYEEDEIGGVIAVQTVNPDAALCRCYFKRAAWSTAVVVPALRAVYAEVFQGSTVKISLPVFEDNWDLRRLALNAGAVEETPKHRPLRDATRRDGKLIGVRILSVFKGVSHGVA
jgi:hypothetical protein